jgi:hypothetical protein
MTDLKEMSKEELKLAMLELASFSLATYKETYLKDFIEELFSRLTQGEKAIEEVKRLREYEFMYKGLEK